MAFDFPATPVIGQVYHPSAGIDYVWTGACWDRLQAPAPSFKMPAGIVDQYAGTVLPLGALWCDGKTFDQAVYPLLYIALGDKNVVPDYRGRVGIGKDDMGGSAAGRVTNVGPGAAGFDAKVLGAAGGLDRYAVTLNDMPLHTHGVSGNTGIESAGHYHYVSGNTGNDSVNHSHTYSGNTGYVSADHSHAWSGTTSWNGDHSHVGSQMGTAGIAQTGSGRQSYDENSEYTSVAGGHNHTVSGQTGGISANHVHAFSGTSSGVNTWHQHAFAANTGDVSANHTHAIALTATGVGGGLPHSILQPSIVTNYVIWTGT